MNQRIDEANTGEQANQGVAHMKLNVVDVPGFLDTYREMIEERRLYLARLQSQTQQMCAVNEQAAGFYEKLVLLDGGTIALSLTFLGSLLSRTVPYHLPRSVFASLVCPAWCFLLLSIFHSWKRISALLNINASLVAQLCLISDSFHYLWLGVLVKRMSSLTKGELSIGGEEKDFSQLFSKMGEALTDSESESKKLTTLIERAAEIGKTTEFNARAASVLTTVALILLCTFAVLIFVRL